MCVQLLPLLGSYDQVTPRRPRGGSDGGRDIQARFIPENREIYGAVGFRNCPSDSNEDKRWVVSKFGADLQSAKKAKADLFGFVFFTNVDLTPGEEQNLIDKATAKSISHCCIFLRERLRLVLDSTQGIGIRAAFLEIQLSIEELTAFVSYLGQRHAEELLKLEQRQADLVHEQQELRQATSSLQETISDVAVQLGLVTQQIISTFTGGDSFCYCLPVGMDNGSTGGFVVIHGGKYLLFDVVCREVDIIRFREREEQDLPISINDPDHTRYIEVGNLAPSMAMQTNVAPRLHQGGVLKLNLFFNARNGEWVQLLTRQLKRQQIERQNG